MPRRYFEEAVRAKAARRGIVQLIIRLDKKAFFREVVADEQGERTNAFLNMREDGLGGMTRGEEK